MITNLISKPMSCSKKTLAELVPRLNLSRDSNRLGWPTMIVMTDDVRLPDPVPVARTMPRGSAIILRHYHMSDRSELAAQLAAICRTRGLRLIIAGDARLAIAVKAAGLHLPSAMLKYGHHTWRNWCPPHWLVTAAAHSQAELRRANQLGADAALLAPIFPTASHPGARNLGILRFTALCQTSPLPVYALGGLSPANITRLAQSSIAGIAGIGGFSISDSS